MNFKKFLMAGGALTLLLTSCIDDKYDLADIDTTSRFKVNDLVLPLNLDPVLLSDIIKIEEGDQIKEYTIDGHTFYAVEESGTFSSDPIDVASFDASANQLNPTIATFSLPKSGKRQRRVGEEFPLYFLTGKVLQSLDYEADGIDGAVRALTTLYYNPVHFTMKLMIVEQLNSALSMQLENVTLQLPKGLDLLNVEAPGYSFSASDYSPTTGLISMDKVILNEGEATIDIISTSIDLTSYPNAFSYNKELDEGTFYLDSEFSIEEGTRLAFSGTSEALATIPDLVEFTVTYDVSDLIATAMLGNIQYDLTGENLKIDPVELDNLPSFLENPETNLILSNPQIYLNLNNPVGEYGLTYQSSLDISAIRDGKIDTTFPSPLIVVPATIGSHNILLAPDENNISLIPDEYKPGLERLRYENLGYILSNGGKADGMPEKLDIQLIDPMIPDKPIVGHNPFRLGENLPGMDGTYLFLAPLSLKEGSTIVKTVDGWWSEDLADLTIDNLGISAIANSDLPTGVVINIYAIDRDGNKISEESSVKLVGLAQNEPIEISLIGLMIDGQRQPITNLDGIEIYVLTSDNGNDEALAPSQTITLENLKAKVSGYYTKKL